MKAKTHEIFWLSFNKATSPKMKNKYSMYAAVVILFTYSLGWSSTPETDSAKVEEGKRIFQTTCFACHGVDGKGMVPGTPKLTREKSPLFQDSSVLKEKILMGYQSKGSPMAMPPKGGNPTLTEKNFDDVIVFMKAAFIKRKS